VRRMLGYPPRPIALRLRKPLPQVRRVVPEAPRVQPVAAAVEQPVEASPERRPAGTLVRVVREVICGAVVGGVLGTVAVLGTATDWHITDRVLDCAALGTGIGAVVGFVVGGPRPTPAEKTTVAG